MIIEAMKMETEIRATTGGQVKDIQVTADMTVEAGQGLLVSEVTLDSLESSELVNPS